MSFIVTIDGASYTLPSPGERDWAIQLQQFFEALADGLLTAGVVEEDAVDADTLVPVSAAHDKFKLVGDDGDSRDNPVAVSVFQNDGLTDSPRFAIGNPYVAGVGLNAMGVWYRDDTTGEWLLCFSWEQSGTFASVLDGVRRSAFEAFQNHGDFKPISRLFESSSQMMQVGAGGFLVAPGGAVRSGGVLTLTTATVGGIQQTHKMGVGQRLYKGSVPGEAGNVADFGEGENWGPASSAMTVASVVDTHTITVTDARANATNTEWLSFSTEPAGDVMFGRDSYGVFVVNTKNGARLYVTEDGISMPDGLSVLSAGSALPLGADGNAPVEVTSSQLHVKEGFEFYNEGSYRSTGWFNGGGQTQSSQEVFFVGTGSGNQTTYLDDGKPDWTRLLVMNKGQGGSNTLTVTPTGGETINGAASYVLAANAGATLVKQGTDWTIFYHPPPP